MPSINQSRQSYIGRAGLVVRKLTKYGDKSKQTKEKIVLENYSLRRRRLKTAIQADDPSN